MNQLVALISLLLRFVRAMVVSGLQTVRIILQHRADAPVDAQAQLLRYAFEPLSPTGMVVLASLVSLTPGSTVIRIDRERSELLLHVLEPSQAQALADEIERDFEPALQVLFGRKTPC